MRVSTRAIHWNNKLHGLPCVARPLVRDWGVDVGLLCICGMMSYSHSKPALHIWPMLRSYPPLAQTRQPPTDTKNGCGGACGASGAHVDVWY